MALCFIHLPSKPLKNKLFVILASVNTTNMHKQCNNAKGSQQNKTWKHPPKQTPNYVVYKDAFLHAPSQARRLRPNSLAKDAHNQLQSRFSPEWKLILWQELLNLPETHTATDHKGTSPFPKERTFKGSRKQQGNGRSPGIKTSSTNMHNANKTNSLSYKVINVQEIEETNSHMPKMKRFQNTSYHNSSMVSSRVKYHHW